MRKLLVAGAALALLFLGPAEASMTHDGAWRAGVWAPTVWANNVWQENLGVSVPNVVGQSLATADMTLEAAGLDTGTTSSRCDNTAPLNQVVSQIPAAGSNVLVGSLVNLIASNGSMCPTGGQSNTRIGLRIGIGL